LGIESYQSSITVCKKHPFENFWKCGLQGEGIKKTPPLFLGNGVSKSPYHTFPPNKGLESVFLRGQ
jgi:hypothetical protein